MLFLESDGFADVQDGSCTNVGNCESMARCSNSSHLGSHFAEVGDLLAKWLEKVHRSPI